jgi:hypothetical protein
VRILVVHNRYRSTSPSGENVVVEQDIARYRTGGCLGAGCAVDSGQLVSDEMSLPQISRINYSWHQRRRSAITGFGE